MPRYILPLESAAPDQQFDLEDTPSHTPEDSHTAETQDLSRLAIAHEPHVGEVALPNTVSIVGSDGFELTVTEKLHAAMLSHGSMPQLRTWFAEEAKRILANPLGDTNIDTGNETKLRLVHAVQGPLAGLLPDRDLALKSTGLDTDHKKQLQGAKSVALTEQFRVMHSLGEKQRSVAPAGLGGLIMINEVHGVLAYRDPVTGKPQEWMLMDHIKDAQPVEQFWAMDASNPIAALAFQRGKYPLLARYTDSNAPATSYNQSIPFKQTGSRIAEELNYAMNGIADLNGHNLLEQQTPDGPKYTVIDINGYLA
jgi:hypothetical protein